MSQCIQFFLKVTILCALFAVSVSVAQPRRVLVDPGEIINPSQDPVNEDVNTNSIMAIFMRLEISGSNVTPHDMRLTRIPVSFAYFGEDPSRLVLRAFNASDELVGRTSVADRRMNARDGQTVIRDDRSVSVAVPLVSKPEEVALAVPETQLQYRFSVESAVRDYCDSFAADPFCSDDPPQSSPHFELLQIPEP
jgi:hypothetical protein